MRELFFAYLATRPQFAKPKSCRKSLVGPMRAYLWRHGAAQTGQWPEAPPHALALIADRASASAMLADFCARCGRCEWGVMTSPQELRVLSPAPDTDPGEDHGR
jgi:hypothetical protein